MFCSRCGKENADDAVYCQNCGRAFEVEEETRVATRGNLSANVRHSVDSDPPPVFSITPTLKFVYAGYAVAVVCAFLIVIVLTLFFPAVPPLVAVVVGLLLLLVPLFYHIRKKLVRYTLTDTTVEIDRGLISRTTQNIPLRRIQDVTVSATVAQRMLGLGDVVIDNASEDGGKIVLDDIDSPKKYAELMLRQMRKIEN